MRCKMGKRRVLHLDKNNPRYQRRLGLSCWRGEQGKGTWGPGAQQDDREPALGPCGQEGQRHPGV